MKSKDLIKSIFLYLVSFVGVVMVAIGAYGVIEPLVTMLVENKAWDDVYYGVSESITSLIVGTPILIFGWMSAKKLKH